MSAELVEDDDGRWYVVQSNGDGGYDLYLCGLALVEHFDRKWQAVASIKRAKP